MLYVSLSQVAYRPIGTGKCNIKEKISGMDSDIAGKWCVTATLSFQADLFRRVYKLKDKKKERIKIKGLRHQAEEERQYLNAGTLML